MSELPIRCPHCQSAQVASRGSLFQSLSRDSLERTAFYWYSSAVPCASPPKSLLVICAQYLPLVCCAGLVLYWLSHEFFALYLAWGLSVFAVAFLIDVVHTYRRYQQWREQWVCGRCRRDFDPHQSGQ